MEPTQQNRGTEAFDVGELAVENSDQPKQTTSPPQAPPPLYTTEHHSLDAEVLEPDEHLICIVRRHPIGLVAIYLEALVALVAIFALLLVLTPSLLNNSKGGYSLVFVGLFILLIFLAVILGFVTFIYRKSRMIVTDHGLIQVIQRGLFNRKISRLSMTDVEDVSAEKKGIFAMIFNFGTLNIQTAGEIDNFVFPMCPNPDEYAGMVLDARQVYAKSMRSKD